MAKVDFYVLAATGEHARQQFACKLAEKAYRLANKVHICVPDKDSEKRLDELLWTFRDGSFVPHEIAPLGDSDTLAPVTIGCESPPPGRPDLLINLCNATPENTAAFARVAEVVTSDDESLRLSRLRFVDYRAQGHTLDTHKI